MVNLGRYASIEIPKMLSWKGEKETYTRVTKDKKLRMLKAAIWACDRILPEVEVSELSTREAIYWKMISDEWFKKLRADEADLKKFWHNEVRKGVGDKNKSFNNEKFESLMHKVFNALIQIAESDNYYRDRFMDLIMMVCMMDNRVQQDQKKLYEEALLKMSIEQIKQIAKQDGLPVKGSKAKIIRRIVGNFNNWKHYIGERNVINRELRRQIVATDGGIADGRCTASLGELEDL